MADSDETGGMNPGDSSNVSVDLKLNINKEFRERLSNAELRLDSVESQIENLWDEVNKR